MNTAQKINFVRELPILMILCLLISCNGKSSKRPSVDDSGFIEIDTFEILIGEPCVELKKSDWDDPNYKETEECIEKLRYENYVLCFQYVFNHKKYNQQMDFVWSIPETDDNRIKLDIIYSTDLSKSSKKRKIKDEFEYKGSLSWLRKVGYNNELQEKLSHYIKLFDIANNSWDTELYYQYVTALNLPTIEYVESLNTDAIHNNFIKGYVDLMNDLMIPVMRKYSEKLKIPRPDTIDYYIEME